jgi:hypothetical protein
MHRALRLQSFGSAGPDQGGARFNLGHDERIGHTR